MLNHSTKITTKGRKSGLKMWLCYMDSLLDENDRFFSHFVIWKFSWFVKRGFLIILKA